MEINRRGGCNLDSGLMSPTRIGVRAATRCAIEATGNGSLTTLVGALEDDLRPAASLVASAPASSITEIQSPAPRPISFSDAHTQKWLGRSWCGIWRWGLIGARATPGIGSAESTLAHVMA